MVSITSGIGFVLFLALAFILILILISMSYFYYKEKDKEKFITITSSGNTRYPPYITQSLVINIYTTNNDYPKYKYLFKGALTSNIMVQKGNAIVLVPRTTTNIPINVFTNATTTKFSIVANGIEQEIKECDFIATTY